MPCGGMQVVGLEILLGEFEFGAIGTNTKSVPANEQRTIREGLN